MEFSRTRDAIECYRSTQGELPVVSVDYDKFILKWQERAEQSLLVKKIEELISILIATARRTEKQCGVSDLYTIYSIG